MSQAINWRAGPHSISLTICPEGSYLTFANHEPGNFNLIILTPCVHISLQCTVLYTPTSWKHMPICFYVHIPGAEALDLFLIQISEGLTEWLNHPASCRGCVPSGWLIETARAPFVQPPASSANLQAVLNEMSQLRHGPRPRRWTRSEDTSWAERSLSITAPRWLNWTEECLRWSIERWSKNRWMKEISWWTDWQRKWQRKRREEVLEGRET